MKIDVPYFVLLCALQLAVFSARAEFMPTYNFIVWAAVCGVAFAVYPWLWLWQRGPAGTRLLPIAVHATLLFVLSTAVSFVLLGLAASDHFAEWSLGLFVVAVPSAAASIVSLLVSYGVLRLTRTA